ncbi:MAG: hypothetical protein Q9228_000811 [Teloschistes exilis]
MPPPHCHFTTKAPSSSTVEYTVSTAFPPQTLSSHLLLYISFFVRALLASLISLAVVEYFGFVDFGFYGYLNGAVGSKFWAGAGVVGFLVSRRFYSEESLLVLRTLGIQTTTLSSSYLLPATTRFIPTSQIKDIFIHEAFRGFEVRFYLCVVVEEEEGVCVVFPQILPNREILEQVWRGARQCLYEPTEKQEDET